MRASAGRGAPLVVLVPLDLLDSENDAAGNGIGQGTEGDMGTGCAARWQPASHLRRVFCA